MWVSMVSATTTDWWPNIIRPLLFGAFLKEDFPRINKVDIVDAVKKAQAGFSVIFESPYAIDISIRHPHTIMNDTVEHQHGTCHATMPQALDTSAHAIVNAAPPQYLGTIPPAPVIAQDVRIDIPPVAAKNSPKVNNSDGPPAMLHGVSSDDQPSVHDAPVRQAIETASGIDFDNSATLPSTSEHDSQRPEKTQDSGDGASNERFSECEFDNTEEKTKDLTEPLVPLAPVFPFKKTTTSNPDYIVYLPDKENQEIKLTEPQTLIAPLLASNKNRSALQSIGIHDSVFPFKTTPTTGRFTTKPDYNEYSPNKENQGQNLTESQAPLAPLLASNKTRSALQSIGDHGSVFRFKETPTIGRFTTIPHYNEHLPDKESQEGNVTEPQAPIAPVLAFKIARNSMDEEETVVEDQQRTLERKNRSRQSSINKRQRLSLSVVAVGSENRSLFRINPAIDDDKFEIVNPGEVLGKKKNLMGTVFSFLGEKDLMTVAFTVSTQWADWATDAHANLLLASVPMPEAHDDEGEKRISVDDQREPFLERNWNSVHSRFPWACYLAAGGAKTVYRVYNIAVGQEEAISVMDTQAFESMQIVANELVVSAMLSSLVRRAICPNFIAIHGVFTMAHPPPPSHWGDEEEKYPAGKSFVAGKSLRKPSARKGSHPGRYQYIRMELVNEGDAEELIKRQKDERLDLDVARGLLFQIAFGIFAAADKYSVKHYDIKLLNIFVHKDPEAASGLVLRYGLGSDIFAVKMPSCHPFIAKVADFGTANIVPESNGQLVTMAHFTTLENTPPDFMILGDDATQGYEHDNFGLGLVMLHLATGSRPYEEILEEVKCPPQLKARLEDIWENEKAKGYSVIRSVISDDPFETLYDTLYRFLVLFGIPELKFQQEKCGKVWKAISDSLEAPNSSQWRNGRGAQKRKDSDMTQYRWDCEQFSIRTGTNKYIARARESLTLVDGGLDLLFSLCSFDPRTRGTALSVLNSPFMQDLREGPGTEYTDDTTVRSYMHFASQS